MKGLRMITNNLVNITNKSPIYRVKMRKIKEVLQRIYETQYDKEALAILEVPQIPILATDSYYLHYSVYPLVRTTRNPDEILEKVRNFLNEHVKSKEYPKIRALTELDDELSNVYSIKLTQAIIRRLKEELRKDQQFQQRLQKIASETLGKPGTQQAQRKMITQAINQAVRRIMNSKKMKKIMKEAVKEAKEKTDNYKDVKEVLGTSAGKEPGTFEKALNLADKLINTDVKEVISLANKIVTSMPKFTHITKVLDKHGEELAGYGLTRDITKAIKRELALDEDLFWYKLASIGFLRNMKYSTKEGAYSVLIDKSGSMMGEKTIWARSVALALFKLARLKKRRYFLRFFDYEVYPPGKPIEDPIEIVESILTIKSDGGTHIDKAIKTALKDLTERRLCEFTNTIILITDGEDEVITTKEELRKANAKLVSIMIQGYNETLRKISDSYLRAELTRNGALKVVSEAEK